MTDKNNLLGIVRCAAAAAVFSVLIFSYADFVSNNATAVETYASADSAALKDYVSADAFPETAAEACILTDARTGEAIYENYADKRLPMASTTKIMTALVVLENAELDAEVTIPKEAAGIEGSSIYLAAGEVLTVRELLYGLLLESGNDSAAALAVHVGGNTENFVGMMNKKAEALGLCDTHFDNPHGLSSETHYTTARELAKITAYALENEIFSQIVSTDKYVIAERENCRARYFSNHNKLLRSLDICDGVKTGYTKDSGRCLVTSASYDESRFVAVTLNDRRDWKDHMEMLTFAANSFESIKIAERGELIYSFRTTGAIPQNITVQNEQDIYITIPKNSDAETVSVTANLFSHGFESGSEGGYITVTVGEKSCRYPLAVIKVSDAKLF